MNCTKKIFWFLRITCLTLTLNSLQGNESDECGAIRWEVAIDFLEWKPCINGLDYATRQEGTDPNVFKVHRINPQWEPGIRFSLIFPELYSNWDLIGTYIYLSPDGSSSSGQEKAKWDANYHEWEALLGYDILSNEYYNIKTLFGLAGAAINQHLTSDTKWKAEYCGTGLRLGAQCTYRLSENFEFLVKGNGSLLVGEAHTKSEQMDLVIKDRSSSQLISGYQIGTGLLYETSLLNIDTLLKIGYEFNQWQNVPHPRLGVPIDDVAISTSDSGRNFGFHGVTIGLMMQF
jgi:hypothetical protein